MRLWPRYYALMYTRDLLSRSKENPPTSRTTLTGEKALIERVKNRRDDKSFHDIQTFFTTLH